MLDAAIERGERLPDGQVRVTVEGGRQLTGDEVLAALGRLPATSDVGLDAAGVELDGRGFVRVDEHLRTTEPGTFALGDDTGGPQFTHVALDDYRIAPGRSVRPAGCSRRASSVTATGSSVRPSSPRMAAR